MAGRSVAPLALLALLAAGPAHAQPKKKPPPRKNEKVVCANAHAEGQELQRAGKLKDARELFITCGREVCPGPVRADCTKWLEEATQAQPSIVVRAKDERGMDTQDARIEIDGVEAAARLDGRSIDVDPGAHEVRVVAPDGKAIVQQLVLAQGEKHRTVLADFTTLAPKKPPPPEPIPLSALVLGGIGVGALGNFVFWGVLGKNKQAELEETCAPRCAQSDAEEMRRDFVLADVSLAIGLVALGVGTAIGVSSQLSSRQRERPHAIRLEPFRSGAALSGRF